MPGYLLTVLLSTAEQMRRVVPFLHSLGKCKEEASTMGGFRCL